MKAIYIAKDTLTKNNPNRYLYKLQVLEHGVYFVAAENPAEAEIRVAEVLANFRGRLEVTTIEKLGGLVSMDDEVTNIYGKLL